MDTNSIQYKMANFSGEVARMIKAYDMNKLEVAEKFKDNAVSIANEACTSKEVSFAGKEEWYTIKNLLEGYQQIDIQFKEESEVNIQNLLNKKDLSNQQGYEYFSSMKYIREVLLKFGEPFAIAFAYKMQA